MKLWPESRTLRKWDREVNKRWWWKEIRSMEHEKADGDTVREPGQRVQNDHGAGNIVAWVGGIIEPGKCYLRQRNSKGITWLPNSIPKSRYLTIHELLNFSHFSSTCITLCKIMIFYPFFIVQDNLGVTNGYGVG